MALKRTYSLGLFVTAALLYACSTEDAGNADTGVPLGMGGLPSGSGASADGGSVSSTDAMVGAGMGGAAPGTVPSGTAGMTGMSSTGALPGTAGGSASGMGSDAGKPGGAGDSGIAGDAGAVGSDGGGTTPAVGTCPGLPAVTSYDQKGPFDVKVQMNVVSGGEGCSLFRPGTSLGKDGLKHPIAVWGNGILTSPDLYTDTLSFFASHGIVVIACNSSGPERPCLNTCMDWLVKQNESGDMAGKLDISKELTMGYSWGGGASIDTANRPNVKATVSFHGMPPRQSDPWTKMKSPLLLFTSTGDTFVSASGYVTPNYNASKVPTFYATLQESVDHLYILDSGGGAAKERGPAVAWFRYWACGDEAAKKLFFGADCTLCKSPWKTLNKPMGAFD